MAFLYVIELQYSLIIWLPDSYEELTKLITIGRFAWCHKSHLVFVSITGVSLFFCDKASYRKLAKIETSAVV